MANRSQPAPRGAGAEVIMLIVREAGRGIHTCESYNHAGNLIPVFRMAGPSSSQNTANHPTKHQPSSYDSCSCYSICHSKTQI